MLVSIIIPVKNEERFIEQTIESLIHDSVEKEIWIYDSGSNDSTIEIIDSLQNKYKEVKVIIAAHKNVAQVFNEIYPLTNGKYIALLGAHAIYEKGYISNAVSYLENNECDVVGGPLTQTGISNTGKAIAKAMSSKFGVGQSTFRTSKEKQFVKTVAFAVYKKSIFETTGLLNEQLIKNQDDDMHYRIHAKGFRILMVPEMRSTYFVRENFSSLFLQYFYYGFYKPLVFKNEIKGAGISHFIPSIFVAYLLLSCICFDVKFWFIPLGLYVIINLLNSITVKGKLLVKLLCIPAFFIIHISYGLGFLLGIPKLLFSK